MILRKITFVFALAISAPLWAADAKFAPMPAPAGSAAAYVAQLENGFSIRHHHRQVLDSTTRLFLTAGSDSFVDVPTSSIVGLEKLPAIPQPDAGAAATPGGSLDQVVQAASDRHRIDADLIRSVIHAESGYNSRAVSSKGALGLMQLMPDTATKLGVKDAFNPQHNVDGGTRYLRDLLLQYNGDLVRALAAYNAGPERVARYKGVPPYRETRAYVARVIGEFNRKKLAQRASAARPKAPSAKSIPGKPARNTPPAAKQSRTTVLSTPKSTS